MPLLDAVFCGRNLPISTPASSDVPVCASPHLALISLSSKHRLAEKILLKNVPTKSLPLAQLYVDFGIIRLASALKPPCDHSSSTLKNFAIRATLGARICDARHVIAKCVILQVNRERKLSYLLGQIVSERGCQSLPWTRPSKRQFVVRWLQTGTIRKQLFCSLGHVTTAYPTHRH